LRFFVNLSGYDHLAGCLRPLSKIDLEPLRRRGRSSIATHDVDGLDSVHLVRLRLHQGGPEQWAEEVEAADIFNLVEKKLWDFPDRRDVVRAVFAGRFVDSPGLRRFAVGIDGDVECESDADLAVVQDWLARRRFLRTEAGTP
jgi:hypothetical protein